MPVTLKDLRDDEARLIQERERINEEIEALRTLMAIRQSQKIPTEHTRVDIRGLSVEKAVTALYQELSDKWMTGAEISEEMLSRNAKEGKSLRENIGNAQRKLYNEERLDRKNIGYEGLPRYQYRWKGEE